MHSQDQIFAQNASRLVLKRASEPASAPWCKKYGRQCLRLPALILQCGLCQTVAFFEAKAQDGSEENSNQARRYFSALLDDLAEALGFTPFKHGTPQRTDSPRSQLIEKARMAGLTEYQKLNRDALQCANYFKRYAEAILKVQLGEDTDTESA
jgi:CRISPR-associated protein Cmr5